MRIPFGPTIRRPAFSITALTAPVRFRLVASGLMIEKVRSRAMGNPFARRMICREMGAYSGAFPAPQARRAGPKRKRTGQAPGPFPPPELFLFLVMREE